MSSKSPKQIVEERFGGRDKLVDAVLSLLDDKDDRTKARLKRTTNAHLLATHRAASEVKQRFQSKRALVDAIVAARCPGGKADDAYQSRLNGYSVKRLLDLHRQSTGR